MTTTVTNHRRLKIIPGSLLLLLAWPALARFAEEDRELIDPESEVEVEYYNDEISYRYPLMFERLWPRSNLGLRFNGGSYNGRRFMWWEHIKFLSDPERSASLGYDQQRYIDLISDRREREFRIMYNDLRPVHLSFLVDGDSYKQDADFGLAIRLWPEPRRNLEFSYWSVDRIYNTKKLDPKSKMRRAHETYKLKGEWQWTSTAWAALHAEVDTPVDWYSGKTNYNYHYERRYYEASARYGDLDEGWSLTGLSKLEQKREWRDWLDGDGNRSVYKGYSREFYWHEMSLNYASAGSDVTTGAVWLERHVDYDWESRLPEGETPDEEEDIDTMRLEWAHYATWYWRDPGSDWGYQIGLHSNGPKIITADSTIEETEVKFQTLAAYWFDEGVSATVNISWDVDRVVETYPFDEEEFNPWGGGNLQIQALF